MGSPETAVMTQDQGSNSTAMVVRSIAEAVSKTYDMSVVQLMSAVKFSVFPRVDRQGNPPSDANIIAYLSVCHHNGLDPFAGMVWPFPMKDGGFKPATSVDGWLYIMNNHPDFEGYEYEELTDKNGKLYAGKMTIHRKGRKPTVHTEYLEEVVRNTEPWKMVHRMLENRTVCQTVRRAFGTKGLIDFHEMAEAEEINITGQSSVLERTTMDAKEQLKEKMGAKKNTKAATPSSPMGIPEALPPQPTPAEAQQSIPEPAMPEQAPAAQPEPTVIQPQPTAQPAVEPKMSEEQRKAFLKFAEDKSVAIKATVEQAKAKMREIVFNLGATKFIELPASKFDEAMKAMNDWTLESEI